MFVFLCDIHYMNDAKKYILFSLIQGFSPQKS